MRTLEEVLAAHQRKSAWSGFPMMRMYVCATCGNKRCPCATDCRKWRCSGSNDPSQIPVLRGNEVTK